MSTAKRSLPILQRETPGFLLSFEYSKRHDAHVLKMKSRVAAHFAEHSRYNLLAEDGTIIESRPITEDVAKFIIDNFDARGDTASFDIYRTDLEANRLLPRKKPEVAPSDVRHKLTTTEQSFTATGSKLAHHWPIFEKLRDTGYGSIIRATMTLHQVCSSRCQYCSTIARNRKDSISFEEAVEFVEKLYTQQAELNRAKFPEYNRRYREATGSDIRLKGLILSGGGQPNLWPHFEPFTRWLVGRDIDVGLITNGFPERVPDDVYEHFTWIRISITPEDASPHYVDGKFNKQRLPETIKRNKDLTVGYSYVYGPWTDDGILRRIDDSMNEHEFSYCRLLTDCNLTRTAQLRAHQALSERLYKLGYIAADGTPRGRFFHQLKYHGTPDEAAALWDEGQCFLQSYNVFWDTTGHEENGKSYCYACDSITVLAEEPTDDAVVASERRFNHARWGTTTNDQVERLFLDPVKPFFDPRKECSACLFMRNNAEVKELVRRKELGSLAPDASISHLNFP